MTVIKKSTGPITSVNERRVFSHGPLQDELIRQPCNSLIRWSNRQHNKLHYVAFGKSKDFNNKNNK